MARSKDYKTKYRDVASAIDEVFRKREMTIARRLWRALPYGIEMALIAILIPHVTASLTGWSILLPGVVVVLVAIVLKIVRSDYALRARAWWAEKTSSVLQDLIDLASRLEGLELSYSTGETRLTRLSRALQTLQAGLKSDVLAMCGATKEVSGPNIQVRFATSVGDLHRDLKALCQYISHVLGASDGAPVRSGVLVVHPTDRTRLIPLVVYDPSDPDYRSESVFTERDFSGQLLQRFCDHLGEADWKHFVMHVIPDVDAIDSEEETEISKPIYRRPQHKRYIKSIAGNVIYCRDAANKVLPLGVLNIDSPIAGAISEETYRDLQPYLFPAFRLFATRLLLIADNPGLIEAVWKGVKE